MECHQIMINLPFLEVSEKDDLKKKTNNKGKSEGLHFQIWLTTMINPTGTTQKIFKSKGVRIF